MPVTPKLGLNLPIIGSPAWGSPLNVNTNLLERYLTGSLAIPGLHISGNLIVDGDITAGRFLGLTGTFLTSALYNIANGIPQLNGAGKIPSSLIEGGGGGTTYVTAGPGIQVTGAGTQSNPYVISIAQALAIASFAGGRVVDLGTSVVNPAFTASYSGTPTSANITNDEGTSSPTALVAPFTSGSVQGTFMHTQPATTTFTLTASSGSTSPQMATQTIVWTGAIFGGVGVDGATGAVTAQGSNALLSTGDALPPLPFAIDSVGSTYGPFNLNGNRVYLLLKGASHTFQDPGTGFPFAFNAPISLTFVNSQGVAVPMYLYESQNDLFGAFSVKVVS